MMAGGLLFVVLGGMWVLNWLAVVLLTGALGLRRRRWGTPGGGWALASAALHAVAAVGIVMLIVLGTFLAGPDSEELVVGIIAALLAIWVAAHVALARALWAAWQAADLAAAGRSGRLTHADALDAAPTGGAS